MHYGMQTKKPEIKSDVEWIVWNMYKYFCKNMQEVFRKFTANWELIILLRP